MALSLIVCLYCCSTCCIDGPCVQAEYLCHSCYAFAATGALEGMHALKTGQLISLSEQQILDCSSECCASLICCDYMHFRDILKRWVSQW